MKVRAIILLSLSCMILINIVHGTRTHVGVSCKAGEHLEHGIHVVTSGSASQCSGGVITTEEECKGVAEYYKVKY